MKGFVNARHIQPMQKKVALRRAIIQNNDGRSPLNDSGVRVAGCLIKYFLQAAKLKDIQFQSERAGGDGAIRQMLWLPNGA